MKKSPAQLSYQSAIQVEPTQSKTGLTSSAAISPWGKQAMDFFEWLFIVIGATVAFCYGLKTLRLLKLLFPKFWYTLPRDFFTSMGEWAGECDVYRIYITCLIIFLSGKKWQGNNLCSAQRTKYSLRNLQNIFQSRNRDYCKYLPKE